MVENRNDKNFKLKNSRKIQIGKQWKIYQRLLVVQ